MIAGNSSKRKDLIMAGSELSKKLRACSENKEQLGRTCHGMSSVEKKLASRFEHHLKSLAWDFAPAVGSGEASNTARLVDGETQTNQVNDNPSTSRGLPAYHYDPLAPENQGRRADRLRRRQCITSEITVLSK